MTIQTIWVLADDRAGNTAQSLGAAEACGAKIEVKQVRYTKAVLLPNALRGASTIGLTRETIDGIKPPFPDVAIAAGRRAASILKRSSNGSKSSGMRAESCAAAGQARSRLMAQKNAFLDIGTTFCVFFLRIFRNSILN